MLERYWYHVNHSLAKQHSYSRRLESPTQDIKAAFDSVNRRALWKALRSRGRPIPDVLTDLIAALHENTGAAIRVGKNKSARLETTSGVRQGCILAPSTFLCCNRLDTEPYDCEAQHQHTQLIIQ